MSGFLIVLSCFLKTRSPFIAQASLELRSFHLSLLRAGITRVSQGPSEWSYIMCDPRHTFPPKVHCTPQVQSQRMVRWTTRARTPRVSRKHTSSKLLFLSGSAGCWYGRKQHPLPWSQTRPRQGNGGDIKGLSKRTVTVRVRRSLSTDAIKQPLSKSFQTCSRKWKYTIIHVGQTLYNSSLAPLCGYLGHWIYSKFCVLDVTEGSRM